MKLSKKVAIIAIATSSLILSSSPAFAGQINGSGATFAQPLIDVCKVEFTKDTGHTVNYTIIYSSNSHIIPVLNFT